MGLRGININRIGNANYDVDYANGDFNNLQIKSCGLGPMTEGVEGIWTSEILVAEPGQSFGRIHFDTDESDNYIVEVSTSERWDRI